MDFDYEKYTDNELTKAGFNTDELTQEQKNVITEPTEAPENYYCDGEITGKQAYRFWNQRLTRCGLTASQKKLAITYNFG
jgi:hypothetical protein